MGLHNSISNNEPVTASEARMPFNSGEHAFQWNFNDADYELCPLGLQPLPNHNLPLSSTLELFLSQSSFALWPTSDTEPGASRPGPPASFMDAAPEAPTISGSSTRLRARPRDIPLPLPIPRGGAEEEEATEEETLNEFIVGEEIGVASSDKRDAGAAGDAETGGDAEDPGTGDAGAVGDTEDPEDAGTAGDGSTGGDIVTGGDAGTGDAGAKGGWSLATVPSPLAASDESPLQTLETAGFVCQRFSPTPNVKLSSLS